MWGEEQPPSERVLRQQGERKQTDAEGAPPLGDARGTHNAGDWRWRKEEEQPQQQLHQQKWRCRIERAQSPLHHPTVPAAVAVAAISGRTLLCGPDTTQRNRIFSIRAISKREPWPKALGTKSAEDTVRMTQRLFGDGEKVSVWILSEFGKPIFTSSCGREDELSSVFPLIQVFVRRYESWKDTLVSIHAPPNLFLQFSHRSPLILCIASRHPFNLRLQLDIVYAQVISILTSQIIKSIFNRLGDNFDLRRYLDGINKRVDACIKGFNEDPVVFLSGFRILPLNPADRDFLCTTMSSIINEHSSQVVFGILVVHRQLVAMVRTKKYNLTPSDFNDVVVNVIECHSAQQLLEGETWVPICLPQFNQGSFLHAHISYLWEGAGPCLLLLSCSKEAFEELRTVRSKIEEAMLGYKRCTQLKAALSHPEPFSPRQVTTNNLLRHFIYRNVLTSQVCCSTPQVPYISHEEVGRLYAGYFKLSDMLRRGRDVKMFFLSTEDFSLLSWITTSFELHCTFSPLVTHSFAMSTAERMLRVLRREEKRVFFDTSTGLLQ